MTQSAHSVATVALLLVLAVAAQGEQFSWSFEDFVHDTIHSITGDNGSGEPVQTGNPAKDAIVCTQEVVCGADGETYPNPCIAREAGVEVVPCPRTARSGVLLGIPDALLDVGQDFLDIVKYPFVGGAEASGSNKGQDPLGNFNPDPLNLFDDQISSLFQGLGRRLLRQAKR